MALYGALAKDANLSDLTDAAAATANLKINQSFPGNHFWVDGNHASAVDDIAHGARTSPFASINFANTQCTASNGDVIWVLPNHNENVSDAADLVFDVIGVTVVFLGTGNTQARITFDTATDADMDIDAEGVTLISPYLICDFDALTGPIDVNAANFKMYNVRPADKPGKAAIDWYVADANADDLLIDGWFYEVSTTGAQKQSNIQVAGATRPVLRNIHATGDFGTGVIENGTAWVDATLDDIFVDNAATGPVVGVLLQATSTGQARNMNVRVASGTTYITAGNDMQFYDCWGVGVDADGGEQIGAIIATSIEGKIDIVDGLFDVPTADATTDTTMRDVIGRKTDTASTALVATASIMSYIKGLVQTSVRTAVSTAVGTTQTPKTLFTIAGGTIHVLSIIGTVITEMASGARTQQLQAVVTAPSGTVVMSTAVDTDADAVGTVYHFLGVAGVLTPVTQGVVLENNDEINSAASKPTSWIIPAGIIGVDSSATGVGDVTWVMTYVANSGATVVAS